MVQADRAVLRQARQGDKLAICASELLKPPRDNARSRRTWRTWPAAADRVPRMMLQRKPVNSWRNGKMHLLTVLVAFNRTSSSQLAHLVPERVRNVLPGN